MSDVGGKVFLLMFGIVVYFGTDIGYRSVESSGMVMKCYLWPCVRYSYNSCLVYKFDLGTRFVLNTIIMGRQCDYRIY